jgi:hypothetical protein
MCLAEMRLPDGFRDAQALADFANLNREDATQIADFRRDRRDFAPDEWWDYKFEREDDSVSDAPKKTDSRSMVPDWHDTQSGVHVTWDCEFKFATVFVLTHLLRSVFVASEEMVRTGKWHNMSDAELCDRVGGWDVFAFHRGVLFLNEYKWRAKICRRCKKYFVAKHPKRDFCEYPDANGVTCRRRSDRQRKLENYHTREKKRRQEKNRMLRRQKQRLSAPRLPIYRGN